MKMSEKSWEEELVKSMSKSMSIGRLMEESEKTASFEDIIKNEIKERGDCPECDTMLYFDESESELYCPSGCICQKI